MEYGLIWHGKMLPPISHDKPCKLCRGEITVGERFGVIMPVSFPRGKHFVVHVGCFDAATGEVTPTDARPKAKSQPVETPDVATEAIDISDWR